VHGAGTLHCQLCILGDELVLQEQQRQPWAAAEECDTGYDAGETIAWQPGRAATQMTLRLLNAQ
jgi:uncharacterized Fe-S cluster protein YjdI